MSSSFVGDIMSRNYFKKGREYLHACDNGKFSSDENWAKLRFLFDIVNDNLRSGIGGNAIDKPDLLL